ncbi:membrane-bound serine protease (ClpP class) [Cytobacillus oceanisediminis]|jgi:membrane-bound serine protease (ClpP class)|uniref:Membrane-bound serine protease (ClpP class) n=1 Tax=Cytobacillus oceanisediminis TaxID=665099 RepID=A0A2V2ZQB9_9BACI|nr:nodulation protein NfeD [Cytobacillus oceanisediminis]PWW26531.1 membrane-bound serine protease (ClpP class) [Cytobacillus oceanisediminis]
MTVRRLLTIFSFLLAFVLMAVPFQGKADNEIVYIAPIEETVEKGLYAFLSRAVQTAEEENASAIIFEINTPGGAVDAAGEIGKLLTSTKVKTISFVNKQALSAGAYISLNTDEIYMVPGSTMGSAAIIDQQGNTAGKKAESYWFAAMQSAARQTDRDPIYALAMADESVDLPKLGAPKGKLLTLTAEQAEEVGYSEGTVDSRADLLKRLGYENAQIRTIDESFAEKLARFITHPVVVPILLSIGSLGLVLELYSPGFGIPGFMGLSALLLFFYGHMVAGLAGYETLILFVIGIGLIIAEFFLPGGIAGIAGIGAILGSLFLATDNVVHMGISLLIALAVSVLASILMIKVFGKRMKFFKKIILTDSTNTERGYISNKSRLELIGLEGYALTALRPSGTVVLKDERIDVVSEGGYIAKGANVKVVKAEGSRIVVREISNLDLDK